MTGYRGIWATSETRSDATVREAFDRRLNHAFNLLERALAELRDLRALEHASLGEPPDAAMMTTLMDMLQTWCRTVQAPEQLLSDFMHAILDRVLRGRQGAAAERNASPAERGIQ